MESSSTSLTTAEQALIVFVAICVVTLVLLVAWVIKSIKGKPIPTLDKTQHTETDMAPVIIDICTRCMYRWVDSDEASIVFGEDPQSVTL